MSGGALAAAGLAIGTAATIVGTVELTSAWKEAGKGRLWAGGTLLGVGVVLTALAQQRFKR